MSQHKNPSLFGHYFNLHPHDAYQHVESLSHTLSDFTDAFKQRIQLEIDYSRSLLRISKLLNKYINPSEPTPISYIASSFRVEHEERARHALELAGYIHSEIEVPCESLALQHKEDLRKIERELKKFEKEGEMVEQAYQKYLKKYYKIRHDWEERMISKNVLYFTPGATANQKEKAIAKLQDEKRQIQQHCQKYLHSLGNFNSFATRYNTAINPLIANLEEIQLQEITLQMDSMRKLIVSQISMFKNIEYDLLNISTQMEALTPGNQIECFVVSNKDVFESPIISIYAEGPILPYRYEIVDLKSPITLSLMESTLYRIDSGSFTWLLENKKSLFLSEGVERLLKRYQENEVGENSFLEAFEKSLTVNNTIKFMPIDGSSQQPQLLNSQEVYSVALEIISGISQILLENERLQDNRIKSIYELLESYLGLHHFYRFIAYQTLSQYQNLHSQRIQNEIQGKHFVILVRVLFEKCVRTRDIFIARSALSLIFSGVYTSNSRQRYIYQSESIRQLQIWDSRDFWSATIFEATYQQIVILPSIERECLKEVYLMRQKNIVFSELVTYCHYMIMLGLEAQEVKKIISRFSRIYHLNDQHERDLNKTIAHSSEQYKNQ